MRGGDIIREARLRAGLSQGDLGSRVGRDRAQIARWERHGVSPSFDTLIALIRACGFDLSFELKTLDTSNDAALEATLLLSPQERFQRMLSQLEEQDG